MEAVFAFYEQSRQTPRAFSGIEGWSDNIRYGLLEDYVKNLIEKAKKAYNSLAV